MYPDFKKVSLYENTESVATDKTIITMTQFTYKELVDLIDSSESLEVLRDKIQAKMIGHAFEVTAEPLKDEAVPDKESIDWRACFEKVRIGYNDAIKRESDLQSQINELKEENETLLKLSEATAKENLELHEKLNQKQ